jgi:hypothetical protein
MGGPLGEFCEKMMELLHKYVLLRAMKLGRKTIRNSLRLRVAKLD